MDCTRFHAIESVLSFPVLNLANDFRFLGFYFKTRCSEKVAFAHVELNEVFIITYC